MQSIRFASGQLRQLLQVEVHGRDVHQLSDEQLLEQMERSVAAQQALATAEELQRRVEAAAGAGGGAPFTLVLLPED